MGAGRACPRASAMYSVACCSTVKPLHMLIPQIEGRRAALFSIGCPGLIRFEQAAAGHWLAGGGWAGELTRRQEGRVDAARRALLRLGAQFTGFMRQDGVALRGISGAPVAVGGEEVHLVIAPRRRGRKRAGPQPIARPPRSRRLAGAVADGPDKWSRWPVERVLEVRRARTATGKVVLEARIRWEGLNPLTLLPWRDTWRPTETADDKRVFNAALLAEVALMAATRFGAAPSGGSRPQPPAAPPPPRPLRPSISRGCKRTVDAVCTVAVQVVGRLRQGPRTRGGSGAGSGGDEWWARQKWRALRGGTRSQIWTNGLSWSTECLRTELGRSVAPSADAELVVVRPSKLRRRRALAEESSEDGFDEEDLDT